MFIKYNTALRYYAAAYKPEGMQTRLESTAREQAALEREAKWNALCHGNPYTTSIYVINSVRKMRCSHQHSLSRPSQRALLMTLECCSETLSACTGP